MQSKMEWFRAGGKRDSVGKCHLFEQTTAEMPKIIQDFFFLLKDTLYCKFGF